MATLQQKFDCLIGGDDHWIFFSPQDKDVREIVLWRLNIERRGGKRRVKVTRVLYKISYEEYARGTIENDTFISTSCNFSDILSTKYVRQTLDLALTAKGIEAAVFFAGARKGAVGRFRDKDGDDAIVRRIVAFL